MAYNLNPLKTKVGEVKEWLSREFSSIRTGQASPALLDGVTVESYGSRQPIKFIANIGVEGAKSLLVTPWDKSNIKAIESAIAAANLGLSTAPGDNGVRVIFPDLTEDRRKSMLKIVSEKQEEAKISLRKEREKVWNEVQDKERAGEIPEDEKFQLKDQIQKMIDDGTAEFEMLVEKKKREVMN